MGWGGVGGWGTHAREVKRGKRYAISEHLYITKTVVTAQRHKEEEDDEDDGEGERDTGGPEPDEREEEHDMVKGREGGRSCCFWIFSTRKMHLHLRPAIVHVAKRMFHMVDTRRKERERRRRAPPTSSGCLRWAPALAVDAGNLQLWGEWGVSRGNVS